MCALLSTSFRLLYAKKMLLENEHVASDPTRADPVYVAPAQKLRSFLSIRAVLQRHFPQILP